MKTIEWTAGTGSQIKVTLEIAYDLDDHGNRRDRGLKVIVPTLYIDDKRQFAAEGIVTRTHPVAVAGYGQVGITRVNYDLIQAATAELDAEIAPHNAAIWAGYQAAENASAQSRNLEKTMAYGEA